MKDIINIESIYFLGIGGIGMSAIARFFHQRGVQVSGYDKTPTAVTASLIEEGIPVVFEDKLPLYPKEVDLVVYTPAIPSSHIGLNFYRHEGYTVVKRSEVLGMITKAYRNICVAGTHGKTTISTMTAHLLRHSGYGCNAFLGGISVNYQTNFWSSKTNLCVIEADEYDRSFHQLQPDIAVISSMDPDHLDIYGTAEAMEDAFVIFTGKIRSGGTLIKKKGLVRDSELQATHTLTYHLTNEEATIFTRDLKVENGGYVFDVIIQMPDEPSVKISGVRLFTGGLHNVENALAAIAVSRIAGVSDEKIVQGLSTFKGVRRRFEYVLAPGEHSVVMIDDYAHHPAELKALIEGVRSLFPERILILAFQPHLFTRTRDLADQFAEVLDMADQTLLLPIYPARELPIEGVNSEMLCEKMKSAKREVVEKEALISSISFRCREKEHAGESVVFVTAGAGDIDMLLPLLKEMIIHGE